MLSESQKQHFKDIRDMLGLTFPTAQKYVRENKYPEAVAIKADIITKGKIPVAIACPDTLGQPLECDKQLAKQCLYAFTSEMTIKTEILLVGVLNYFEIRQPTLYEDLVRRIKAEPGGKTFFAKRDAHRDNN